MARDYSLDQLDSISLQRTFNYCAIDNFWIRLAARITRAIQQKRDEITLADVYEAFAAGKTFPEIQDEIEGITPKTILLGRAFYMAAHPVAYAGRKQQYLRVLCDANIDSAHLTDGARQVFGYATHIDFVGLRDAKDSRIWTAANGRFNAILTKDRAVIKKRKSMEVIDLTRCALLRWKHILKNNGGIVDDALRGMPVLIHVMDARLKGPAITKLLRKHRQSIFEIYEERVSPIIELHKHKACPGIRYNEIIDSQEKIKESQEEIKDRCEMWVSAWLNKIEHLSNGHYASLSKDEQEHIVKTVKSAADYALKMGNAKDPLEIPLSERLAIKRAAQQTDQAGTVGQFKKPALV